MIKFIGLCMFCVCLISSSFIFTHVSIAQEDFSETNMDSKNGKIAACSDYLAFDSVTLDLVTDFQSYESGAPILVSGLITNKNSYPLIGLDIKARLVKDIPGADPARSEIIILDEFDVVSDLSLDASGVHELSYLYPLALNAPSGEYSLLLYVVEQNTFDISGVLYDDSIPALEIPFQVTGNVRDHVYLDQTQIFVGDSAYDTSEAYSSYVFEQSIPVTIPLYNPDSEDKQMKVEYNLYSWNSANPSKKLDTQSEIVTVPAESEIKLQYMVNKKNVPVYYLSITAEPAIPTDPTITNEKTISNIRVTDENVLKPRLNYVGITSYPVQKGTETTLVTCFQNSALQSNQDLIRVETMIYDQNRKEIARSEYEGKVTSGDLANVQTFTPKSNLSQFTVESKIFDSTGAVIDSIEKTYDCNQINSDICVDSKPKISLIAIIVGILLICASTFVLKRKSINTLKI